MCFILTAIKLSEDKNVEQAILDVMKEAQGRNANGTGAVAYRLDSRQKPVIRRDMLATTAEMANDLRVFDVVSYHFRMATIGTVNLENVHFWKKGDWAFAHNGQIYDVGYNGKSDSLAFFEQLIKNNYLGKNGKVKFEKIKEFTNTFNFWGRFIVINLKSKRIYFFGDFQFYLLNRAYMVITSAISDFEGKIWVNGIDFEVEGGIEVLEKEVEGVYMLDPKKGTFKQVFDKFIDTPRKYTNRHSTVNQQLSTTYPTVRSETQRFGFESVGAVQARKEESGNLNSKEKMVSVPVNKTKAELEQEQFEKLLKKEQREKNRNEKSYIKEFYSRLNSYCKKHRDIEEWIWDEAQANEYNEFGRTPTEQELWDSWIVPQLPKDRVLDFTWEKQLSGVSDI